jgi:hypothetical protein
MPLVAAHRLDWNPRRRMVAEASTLRALPGDREEGPSQRPLHRKRGRHLCPEMNLGMGWRPRRRRAGLGGGRERPPMWCWSPGDLLLILCQRWRWLFCACHGLCSSCSPSRLPMTCGPYFLSRTTMLENVLQRTAISS